MSAPAAPDAPRASVGSEALTYLRTVDLQKDYTRLGDRMVELAQQLRTAADARTEIALLILSQGGTL